MTVVPSEAAEAAEETGAELAAAVSATAAPELTAAEEVALEVLLEASLPLPQGMAEPSGCVDSGSAVRLVLASGTIPKRVVQA